MLKSIENYFRNPGNSRSRRARNRQRLNSEQLEIRQLLAATISGAASVNEGSTYELQLNADVADGIYGWYVSWGDGNEDWVDGNPSSTTHVFAAGSNSHTISAVAYGNGDYLSNSLPVTVNNVDPRLTISGCTAIAGLPFTLRLSSDDPGIDTISSWAINWGDGTTESISGNPDKAIHTYADGSHSYTIIAQATDEDGTYSAGSLVVEFNLEWARQFGSEGPAVDFVAALDGSGNQYLAGFTTGAFAGESQQGQNGFDVFLRKTDADGNALWTRQFGSAGSDGATDVKVLLDGSVVVLGISQGAIDGQPYLAGGDVFLRKYDADGNLLWHRQFGTWGYDYGTQLTADTDGSLYVVGQLENNSVFLKKFDADGTEQWSNSLISSNADYLQSIAIDVNAQKVLVASTTWNPPRASDVLITAYELNGTLSWFRTFGTPSSDRSTAIEVDDTGTIFVGGTTYGTFPGQSNEGYQDVFTACLTASGDVQWVRQLGGTSSYYDVLTDLAVDASGVYIGGYTDGAQAGHAKQGDRDGFVAKYDLSGNNLWTRQFGDALTVHASVQVNGVSIANGGGIYVAGGTDGAFAGLRADRFGDGFLQKFDGDGTVLWTNQFSAVGPGFCWPSGNTTDSAGNLLVVGQTFVNLPGETGFGNGDAFLRKYDPQGNILWTRQFGADNYDWAGAVAVDMEGNIYVTGTINIYVTGTIIGSSGWTSQAFLKKFSPDGTELWAQTYGVGYTWGNGVAVDALGNVYVGGQEIIDNDSDGFVLKYSASGSLIWNHAISTSGFDQVYGPAIDAGGNVYVTGATSGSLPGFSNSGNDELFLVKLNSAGNELWAKQYASAEVVYPYGIATDFSGGVYVVGQVLWKDTPGGSWNSDGFIRRYDASGDEVWTNHYVSATGWDFAWQVASDSTGAYFTVSVDSDALATKVAPNGDQVWSIAIGSDETDEAYGIAVSPSGAVYVSGTTQGNIASQPMPQTTDIFVARLKIAPTAVAGGVYSVNEGGTVVLDGSASHDDKIASENLIYQWDLDGDGIFGETGAAAGYGNETGRYPVFSAANLDGNTSVTVSLRVLDDWGLVSNTSTTVINVNNVAPTAAISGPAAAVRGQLTNFTFSAIDVVSADNAAGFGYAIDFGDGTTTVVSRAANNGSPGVFLQHTYVATGTYSVTVTATDKDGGVSSMASAPVTISATLLVGSDLFIGGTTAADSITLNATATAGQTTVVINSVSQGVFAPSGHIYLFGQAGNDLVTANVSSPLGATLDGQGGSDSYVVNFGGLGGNVSVADSGSALDVDTVVVNGTANPDVITLRLGKVEWGNPVLETVFYSGTEDLIVDGKGGSDTIRVIFSQTTILGGDGDDTIIVEGNGPHGLLIDGGNGSDTYVVQLGNLQGPVTINDNGTTGTNSLTVIGTSGDDAMQLTGGTLTSGNSTLMISGISNLTIDGGGGTDSVAVSGTPPAALTMHGLSDYRFQGTPGNDTMIFSPGSKAGEIEYRLNGVRKATITPRANSRIIAHGLAGDDDIQVAGSLSKSFWLYGDEGNDRLKGGSGHDVLLGGDGDDTLAGQSGRDLLIGGNGADRIVGNADDDILIAGLVSFGTNDETERALFAIMQEWTSSHSYLERIYNISERTVGTADSSWGNRLNKSYFLNRASVFDDSSKDILTGCEGSDWFLFDLQEDKATDLKDEVFADIANWLAM